VIPAIAKAFDHLAIFREFAAARVSEGSIRVDDVDGLSPYTDSASPVASPRIVIFDCETTGIDFAQDQIIELCVQRGLGDPKDDDEEEAAWTWRIRPAVAMQPAAQAVHGISMAELEDCPTFADVAHEIAAVFATADIIVGYNVAFDIAMLQAEYARLPEDHACRALDLTGKQIIDALRLWQKCEPRSLQHAHQRFVGDQFAAAHSARADVAATGRVLAGMLKHFGLESLDWNQIAIVSDPSRTSK
jgi:DNA polymerase-3 subunit epsilon